MLFLREDEPMSCRRLRDDQSTDWRTTAFTAKICYGHDPEDDSKQKTEGNQLLRKNQNHSVLLNEHEKRTASR